MKTTSNLIRWAGLSAMAGGILFVLIQMIDPPDVLASVTTGTWVIVHCLSVTMCVLWMLGITGIYARQIEKAGWFGLAGFVLMSGFLTLTAAFTFAEAFILPLLATDAPKFVEGWLALWMLRSKSLQPEAYRGPTEAVMAPMVAQL